MGSNEPTKHLQPAADLLPLLRECLEVAHDNYDNEVNQQLASYRQERVDDAKQHCEKLQAAIGRIESEAPNA
jgi:hypothetical protein